MTGLTLTPTKKARVVSLVEAGVHKQKIADELDCDLSTVYRIYHKYHEKRDFYSITPGKGRPRKLDDHDISFGIRKIYGCAARNATDLQRQFFPEVKPRTLQARLAEAGLPGRRRRKVPLIKPETRTRRLAWANTFYDYPIQFWDAVVFSDESKFNLIGADGDRWCRRRDGDALDPRFTTKEVKFGGGSIMVWGCVTSRGVGRLHRIHGTMTAAVYVDILLNNLFPSLSDHNLALDSTIFQQDNDPKHTSRAALDFFEGHGIMVMPWVASSPDMNIIEHVWNHLDRQVRKRKNRPANLDQLWVAVQEEWYRLDIGFIRALYESMPRRVSALWRARGWNTEY